MADANTPMASDFDKYKNLPGNSQKTKAEQELEAKTKPLAINYSGKVTPAVSNTEEKHEIKKITTGKRQKKPLTTRFKETFLSDESDTVGSYIFWDILVPNMKETISDLVTGAVNIMLFGDAGSRSKGRGRTIKGGYKDYSTVSSSISRRSDSSEEKRYGRRSRKSCDDIIICDRQTAMQVLSDMQDLIVDYGKCTVADYYDMVDQTWEYTDKYWGWTDLSGVRPRPVHGGCVLDLPELEQV
jgi:hypothetical protein